jgi:hypothetical protein
VDLRSLVAKDCTLERVENRKQEGSGISRLVNLCLLHILSDHLNTSSSSESFLILAAFLADVGQDVERKFSDVESAGLSLLLDQLDHRLNQVVLFEVDLEEFEESAVEDGHQGGFSPWHIVIDLNELGEDLVALNLVEVLGHQSHQVRSDVECVDLELKKLRWTPSGDLLILLN